MIEQRIASPVFFIMTTVAIVSLFAFVNIIHFVAINAFADFFIFSACFFWVKIAFVALAAGDFFVFSM